MNNNILTQICISGIKGFWRIDLPAGTERTNTDRKTNALTIKCTGKTTYMCGSKKYLSDPNSVLFVPKGTTYSFHVDEPGLCLMAEFDITDGPAFDTIMSFPVTSCTTLQSCHERAANCWMFKKPAYYHRCLAELYNMLTFIEEQQVISYRSQRSLATIKPALIHLEENCSDPNLSTSDLAGISGISEIYFRKIFTSLYGTSPAKYIRTVRIEKAKSLLISENISVSEAAELSGFVSLYHFSRTFKSVVGVSPTEYKNKIRSDGLL